MKSSYKIMNWKTPAGLKAFAIAFSSGNINGYVEIDKKSILSSIKLSDLSQEIKEEEEEYVSQKEAAIKLLKMVQVHRGITYIGKNPQLFQTSKQVIGFDTLHSDDKQSIHNVFCYLQEYINEEIPRVLLNKEEVLNDMFKNNKNRTFKSLEYVVTETNKLATQLAKIEQLCKYKYDENIKDESTLKQIFKKIF